MKLFNHVQIKVQNLQKSRKFYDSIMSILGYQIVLTTEDVIGYGTSVNDMFEIRQATKEAPLSASVHIAFNASSKEIVHEFYRIALELGATSNGQPGYRTVYAENYYAAFVCDPDGHNIEAVYIE